MTQTTNYPNVKQSATLIEKVIANRGGDNPLKGECYIASMVLYELYDGKNMNLVKKMDVNGQYHWWLEYWSGNKIEIIDITREQYVNENKPCPSDNPEGRVIGKPMRYQSYKKRIRRLKDELTHQYPEYYGDLLNDRQLASLT